MTILGVTLLITLIMAVISPIIGLASGFRGAVTQTARMFNLTVMSMGIMATLWCFVPQSPGYEKEMVYRAAALPENVAPMLTWFFVIVVVFYNLPLILLWLGCAARRKFAPGSPKYN